ncbi:Hypothetical protein R9X50_00503800 [Acrodontium crateriforme]|uniref:FAD-binding domain-containing protein n=1 Tax=Acrodontium crateriforme TaxID=150365 RepID=A0AAQ3M8M9_9PEZI|nr:Hypothetical protein R9X50_00503800 [Acrodontium crateriforme]
MNPTQPVIAVVGGGISGVILTIALTRRGLNVQLYEQAAKFGEIGAGVAFGPNAVRAMGVCSPDVTRAFETVVTRNQSPEKQQVWFDFCDGFSDYPVGEEKVLFTLANEMGVMSVHRANFLDAMVKLVPDGITQFNKRLESIEEPDSLNDKVKIKFQDGTEALADAVIGCDGIKSRTRAWMLGQNHPGAKPVYTHKYAYRGLIPMEKAIEALGEQNAKNAKMHLGRDGHFLTFPVQGGKTMNVVAFRTKSDPWPDQSRMTKPSTKEAAFADFKDFGPTVQKIIELLEPNLDIWGIFDTGDHPMAAYNKGRVCVVGDAAHATSPHHGAGAGICIEDSAVLAELLASPEIRAAGMRGFEAAFQIFSDCRKERTQWLVQSSRRSGDLYEWRAKGVEDDFEKIGAECKERCEKIWDGQIEDMCHDALSCVATALQRVN